MIANSEGLSLLKHVEDLKRSHSDLETSHRELETCHDVLEKESKAHHQVLMELRQRTLMTWVRDSTTRKQNHV